MDITIPKLFCMYYGNEQLNKYTDVFENQGGWEPVEKNPCGRMRYKLKGGGQGGKERKNL